MKQKYEIDTQAVAVVVVILWVWNLIMFWAFAGLINKLGYSFWELFM